MIVITTPTGRIGAQLLDRLADSAKPIRVIARHRTRLDERLLERVDVVEGSHADVGVLARAFDGAEAVFWVVPPDPQTDDVLAYYRAFGGAARAAIAQRGVKRIVAVTSMGRDYGKDAGLLSGAFAMEQLLESAGVSYRGLAMPFFMENLLAQIPALRNGVLSMLNADRPLATVATRDIAAVAADLLLDDSWSGQESITVVGPDRLTPAQMAQTLSEVLDRPIALERPSADAFRQRMRQFGVSDAWAQGILDMVAAQDDGIYDREQEAARPAPTSLRQWAEEVLQPAVAASADQPL